MADFDGGGSRQIELLTATRLWNFPTRIYSIGRLRLSFFGSLSWRTVGYAAAVFVPAFLVGRLVGLPLAGLGITVQVVLPGLLVWWALRYAAEGGSPGRFAVAAGRYGWSVLRGVPVDVRARRGVRVSSGRRGVRVRDGRAGSASWRACSWVLSGAVVLGGPVMVERLRARGARPGVEEVS